MQISKTLAAGVFVALIIVAIDGCGDDGEHGHMGSAGAVYAGSGPFAVGVTTLTLADRLVEVWYPAPAGSESGLPAATYEQTDPLPAFLATIVQQVVPEGTDLTFETPAFEDLPISGDGPFPIVLFSHGFGGWRLANSALMAGVASWGFVVASPDHLERGLAAVSAGTARPDPEKDHAVLLTTLDMLMAENEAPGGRFAGRLDPTHVAVTGHSAGGAAALALATEPQIDAVVGYAAAGNSAPATGKPTMLIVASGDIVVTPESTETIFAALPPPKRFVVVGQTGHNSFSDSCKSLREGTALTQVVRDAGLPIDEALLRLAENGCEEGDLDPDRAWSIFQHFTVAHLRDAFGIDARPVGLGTDIDNAFGGVPVTLIDE